MLLDSLGKTLNKANAHFQPVVNIYYVHGVHATLRNTFSKKSKRLTLGSWICLVHLIRPKIIVQNSW